MTLGSHPQHQDTCTPAPCFTSDHHHNMRAIVLLALVCMPLCLARKLSRCETVKIFKTEGLDGLDGHSLGNCRYMHYDSHWSVFMNLFLDIYLNYYPAFIVTVVYILHSDSDCMLIVEWARLTADIDWHFEIDHFSVFSNGLVPYVL